MALCKTTARAANAKRWTRGPNAAGQLSVEQAGTATVTGKAAFNEGFTASGLGITRPTNARGLNRVHPTAEAEFAPKKRVHVSLSIPPWETKKD